MGSIASVEMTIRPGRAEDLDPIVGIFRACWQEAYRDVLGEDVRDAMTVEKANELWRPALSTKSDRKPLVACLGDTPIGVTRIGSDPDSPSRGHIFSLYVDPKNAGRGVGKGLLSQALSTLKDLNFKEISLWVFKANPGAIGLYKRMGFEPTGRERIDDRWKSLEIEMLHSQFTGPL